MTKHRLHTLIVSLLLAIAAWGSPGMGAWEMIKTETRNAKPIVKDADVEIYTEPGYLIVNTGKEIDIKVFTILGRVISQETLPPGSSRMAISTHGVYIVKVGVLTCKIAL